MIIRTALSIAVLVFGALPALAATHYFVANGQNSSKCGFVSKRPDGKMAMAVGGAHTTKASAESATTSSASCKIPS
jgi:hypothetical protein